MCGSLRATRCRWSRATRPPRVDWGTPWSSGCGRCVLPHACHFAPHRVLGGVLSVRAGLCHAQSVINEVTITVLSLDDPEHVEHAVSFDRRRLLQELKVALGDRFGVPVTQFKVWPHAGLGVPLSPSPSLPVCVLVGVRAAAPAYRDGS